MAVQSKRCFTSAAVHGIWIKPRSRPVWLPLAERTRPRSPTHMSLRKDLVEHSTGFLPPGSQIRQRSSARRRQTSPSSSSPTSLASRFSGSSIAWWWSPTTPSTCWIAPSLLGVPSPSCYWAHCRGILNSAQFRVDGANSTSSASATGSTSDSTPTSPPPTERPVSDTEYVNSSRPGRYKRGARTGPSGSHSGVAEHPRRAAGAAPKRRLSEAPLGTTLRPSRATPAARPRPASEYPRNVLR